MTNAVKRFSGLLIVALMITSVGFAKDADERIIEKSREAVEKAGPHDWETYAESAEKCIRKNINVEEALEWLDKSIAINPNKDNLTLKGDYYLDKKFPLEAMKCYLKAAEIIYSETNRTSKELQEVQAKIRQALDLKQQGY